MPRTWRRRCSIGGWKKPKISRGGAEGYGRWRLSADLDASRVESMEAAMHDSRLDPVTPRGRPAGNAPRRCRQASRPAVSEARLSLTPGGLVRYQLKTPYSDGTTHVLFEPLDFLARLAALAAQTAGQSHPLPRRVRAQQRAPGAGNQGPPGQGRKRPGRGPDRRQNRGGAPGGDDLGTTPQARVQHRHRD